MTLRIQVTNLRSKFLDTPPDSLVAAIRLELRYRIEGAQFMKNKFRKGKPMPEYRHLYDKRSNTFPTGLLQKVEEILHDQGVSYTIDDQRPDYQKENPIENLKTLELRDYQQQAEDKLFEHKNCVVRIATGGGKTAIFTSALGKLNGHPRIILVRRQLLFLQTIEVLEKELGCKVGRLGAGEIDIQPLTVAMIPTVARAVDPKYKYVPGEDDEDDQTKLDELQKEQIKDYVKSVACVVFDECHGIAAETAQLVANHAESARYRWGFSATPWRTDGKDILITAATGPRVVDIDASFLIERGFLVPPHIYFFKTTPPPITFENQKDYQKVYKELIVDNDARNEQIFKVVCQAYERYEHILILVHQIDHGKNLLEKFEDAGMWAEYLDGSSTINQRQETIARFQNKVRGILIGSSILDEGIDIPAITTLVNAGGGKSSARYYQKIGRAIRTCEDKTRAIVVDFLDEGIKYMCKHARERLKIIRTEALYKIKVQGDKG